MKQFSPHHRLSPRDLPHTLGGEGWTSTGMVLPQKPGTALKKTVREEIYGKKSTISMENFINLPECTPNFCR
jgi:hypothetical protein